MFAAMDFPDLILWWNMCKSLVVGEGPGGGVETKASAGGILTLLLWILEYDFAFACKRVCVTLQLGRNVLITQ